MISLVVFVGPIRLKAASYAEGSKNQESCVHTLPPAPGRWP